MVVQSPPHIACRAVLDEWPEGFLASCAPDQPWLVVRSLPRHEKQLIRVVRDRGIAGCMFYERRLHRYPKGLQENLVPLLGGYVFVAGGEAERETVYATGRCLTVLAVPRPDEFHQEVASLAALVRSNVGEVVVRPEIVPGKKVRIAQGPLEGAVGIVRKRRGASELVINLHVLGHSVRSRLPADIVEEY